MAQLTLLENLTSDKRFDDARDLLQKELLDGKLIDPRDDG